jgi:hypothetical protein
MTPDGARKLIAVLTDGFPRTTFSESAPDTWRVFLNDYDDATVFAALPTICARTAPYAPEIGTFLQVLTELITGQPSNDAQQAWKWVLDVITMCGCERVACCRSELAAKVALAGHDPEPILDAVESITWRRIGLADYSEHGTLFAQFRSCLDMATKRTQDDQRRTAIAAGGALQLKGGN